MPDMIAGHTFVGLDGRCSCGKRFSDISGAGPENVGKPDWAHAAHLSFDELQQIVAERERMWGTVVGSASAPK